MIRSIAALAVVLMATPRVAEATPFRIEIRTWLGWSHPIELTLPPGEHEIRLTPKVYVKAFRLERVCR